MTKAKEVKKPLLARIVLFGAKWFWYGSNVFLLGYAVALLMVLFSGAGTVFIMLSHMPKILLLVLIAFMLRSLVRSAHDGSPFTFENANRLGIIGLSLLFYGPLNIWSKWVGLSHSMQHHNLHFRTVEVLMQSAVESAGTVFFLGLLILALAHLLKTGVRLQHDSGLAH